MFARLVAVCALPFALGCGGGSSHHAPNEGAGGLDAGPSAAGGAPGSSGGASGGSSSSGGADASDASAGMPGSGGSGGAPGLGGASGTGAVGGQGGASTFTVVGPPGGSITIGGVTLTVPPDALATDTQITVDVLDGATAQSISQGMELRSSVYVFKPHGLAFATPVTIEFPFTGPDSEAEVATKPDDAATTWSKAVATLTGGIARIETSTFSYYLGRKAQGLPQPGCGDSSYQSAWTQMTTALDGARGCSAGANACAYEARTDVAGTCTTLGFANSAVGAQQMVSAFNSFRQATAGNSCGYELISCDSDAEFSAPSYCNQGKCGKCSHCAGGNPPPPPPGSGTPMIGCSDSSSVPSCADGTVGTVQIIRQGGSGSDIYLKHNDDQTDPSPVLTLTFTSSDQLNNIPQYEFRVTQPGEAMYLGPEVETLGSIITRWKYRLIWAVYAREGACTTPPVFGCRDSELGCAPLPLATPPDPLPPSPTSEVFLYNKPWWNGFEWRGEIFFVNRRSACNASGTMTVFDMTNQTPGQDQPVGVGVGEYARGVGPSFTGGGAVPLQRWRYVIKDATLSSP